MIYPHVSLAVGGINVKGTLLYPHARILTGMFVSLNAAIRLTPMTRVNTRVMIIIMVIVKVVIAVEVVIMIVIMVEVVVEAIVTVAIVVTVAIKVMEETVVMGK